MPPKKKKKQSRKTTQSQRQSQKVTINIGSKSKPRKKSGRGGLPPPSYQHNLAPTFITAPQVDYTPLLAMMQHHARPIVEQAPMPITQTPLSASIQASNAEQMAGEAAIRRAGPTAANFQPHPSLADERSRSLSEESLLTFESDVSLPYSMRSPLEPSPLQPSPRQADEYKMERLVEEKPRPEPRPGGMNLKQVKADFKKMSTQEKNELYKRYNITGKKKEKQYYDMYKFGE